MYSREEASKLKEAFWTAFGQYISPHLSAEGTRVNWVNYKTGIKHLYFRMRADHRMASIAIEIAHPDAGIRELFFEQFLEFKTVLHEYLQEEWKWELLAEDDSQKPVGRISTTIYPVSVFKQGDWPALISFFKPRIIALDAFWSDAKYSFDLFR